MSDYLDDPKAERAFFLGLSDLCGITEQRAREIFAKAVAEDEEDNSERVDQR